MRDRGVGVIHDGWVAPGRSSAGDATSCTSFASAAVDATRRRSRLRPRRLQRGGVPRPELVGHGLGQGRLRHAALRGLARLGLRRLGRPSRAFPTPRSSRVAPGPRLATGGELSTGAGPDLRRLALHVVNPGNDGRLSSSASSSARRRRSTGPCGTWTAWHDCFLGRAGSDRAPRDALAHGGGVSTSSRASRSPSAS